MADLSAAEQLAVACYAEAHQCDIDDLEPHDVTEAINLLANILTEGIELAVADELDEWATWLDEQAENGVTIEHVAILTRQLAQSHRELASLIHATTDDRNS